MKVYIYIIFCICFGLFLNTCTSSLMQEITRYDILLLRSSKSDFSLTDSLTCTYIPLETNNNCLIGDIHKIILSSGYFLIQSDENLFQFDINGKFVRKIASQGRGPGEYLGITDYSVDDSTLHIHILDVYGQKIVIYNMLGEFIEEKKCENMWSSFEVFNNMYIAHPLNFFGNEPCMLKIIDENDSTTCIPNNLIIDKQDFFLVSNVKNFQKTGEEFIFQQQFNDTVYRFNPDTKTFSACYYFDFKSAKLPAGLLENSSSFDNQSSIYGYIFDITESNEYIFLSIFYREKLEKYVINKKNNKTYFVKKNNQNINIWPKWSNEKDVLMDYIQTVQFMDNKEKIYDDNIKKNISKLDEDSNPVIVIMKQKM